MKWLSAGLTFFNASTVCALLVGMIAQGLSRPVAIIAVLVGLAAALIAYLVTDAATLRAPKPVLADPASTATTRKRRRDRRANDPVVVVPPSQRYRSIWFWLLAACFAIFAVRSFCWLIYTDGNELRVQSPNNLGDLSIHLTYIHQFASGIPLWPDNPLFVSSKLRYPAGTDIFNAILSCLGIDLIHGLVWTGLLASIATFYAFYRWGGNFGIAAFLFNGGLASYKVFQKFAFEDYQGANTIAWKSLPLAMFVTQRGLLYALPAGLLLLYQWRARFHPSYREPARSHLAAEDEQTVTPFQRLPLPFWLELSLYATMPLFHVHTFIALSIVLVFLFFFSDATVGRRLVALVAAALIPASFFVWLISDNFHAGSVMEWKPGWVQQQGDFGMPFLQFWLVNFGAWVPLLLFFFGITAWAAWNLYQKPEFKMPTGLAFLVPAAGLLLFVFLIATRQWQGGIVKLILVALLLLPLPFVILIAAWMAWKRYRVTANDIPAGVVFLLSAVAIFFLGYLVKMAPWEWDNIKIIVWAYFIILPFLWTDLIAHWPIYLRAPVCVALFASGFVSLFGGLAAGKPGFEVANRAELDAVGVAVRRLPATARYAGFPTYNHPVLLHGRKMVMGYPGHLWTQGFNYSEVEKKLQGLMRGAPNWKENARSLGARYLFWGREEKLHYLPSTRPWERESALVASGDWGAIYDLESLPGQQARPPN